ncbi:hypothetical protein ABQE48_13045 [Mycolicibacterium thermoresistibile]
MSRRNATLAPGVEIDLGDGLAISAENEVLIPPLIKTLAHATGLTVVALDGFSGADELVSPLEVVMGQAAEGKQSLLVIENIDQLNTMPLHPEFPSLLKIRAMLAELSRLRHPVVVTATEPTVDMIPHELRIGTHVAFEVMAPLFPYALGMTYGAASLDALDRAGALRDGEAYVRVGAADPVRTVIV